MFAYKVRKLADEAHEAGLKRLSDALHDAARAQEKLDAEQPAPQLKLVVSTP